MFCIAFGLSMDYEVFLLSRIKEEHDRTGDNELVRGHRPRAHRPASSRPLALLISVVFIVFATSDITFIKLFGVGLTLAVLMDAVPDPRHCSCPPSCAWPASGTGGPPARCAGSTTASASASTSTSTPRTPELRDDEGPSTPRARSSPGVAG